jgi:hypothetical protein
MVVVVTPDSTALSALFLVRGALGFVQLHCGVLALAGSWHG